MLLEKDTRQAEAWNLGEGTQIAEGRTAIKAIGGGSAYEVYLVWDEHLHALCVAKLLRPHLVADERSLRGLRAEAEILERVDHPVIVRGFDAVLAGEHPHLLIEHLEGPSLRRLIRRGGALPIQQVVPLALSLAGALHYLERMELVHLDVKPDNVIMGVPPRLIDLSIARTLERAKRVSKPIGTDAYMPPEQCDPERYASRIGPPSDVWGLGATLHHAIAGLKPFPPLDDERFPQLFEAPGALPPYVPAELVDLIEQMLAFEPENRPAAAQVAERLEPLVAELPRKLSLSKRLLS